MTPDLIQIVDAALASSVARSGDWLACRPGCSQCCVGVFQIAGTDADRLRHGLAQAEPALATRIQTRIADSRARLQSWFPGDPATGALGMDEEAVELFEEFAADEVCPILDPETGTCDLYAARPILCRTFGPPIRNDEGGLAVCELCFNEAPEAEVARCEMDSSWRDLQDQIEEGSGATIIAFAFPQ